MKIECEKKELLEAVEKVILATSAKPTIPYLSNIYFSAKENDLVLNTLDMEIFMKTVIKAKVKEPGRMVVTAKTLHDLLKANPEGQIKISANEKKVNIQAKTKYDLVMPDVEKDAPEFKEIESDNRVTVEASVLKDMIKKSIFAISTDSLRYVLNGVFFIVEKEKIKMVTTDGKRLIYIAKDCKGNKKAAATAIVPSKAVAILSSLIGEGPVELRFGQNQIQFTFGSTMLITRLIEGNYPNYEQVIPKDKDLKITFGTKEFLESVSRVSIFAADRSTPIKLTFNKNKVMFFEQDATGNCSSDEIEIKYEGKEYSVSYNPAYIVEILKNIDSKETDLLLTSPLNPAVIRPASEEEYINVIMPMRV